MRALRYILLAVALLAAFSLSVVLMVRSLSNIPAGTAQNGEPPPAETSAPATPPPATAPTQPAPPAEKELASTAAPAANEQAKAPAILDEPKQEPFGPQSMPPLGTLLVDRPDILTLGTQPRPDALAGRSAALPPAPARDAEPATGARLALTPEQSERVRYVLLSHNVMQLEAPDIALRVGGTVPADVPLMPFPIEAADVVPAYARYSYVMAQNQIAIVVNADRRIDVVIPIEPR